MARSSHWPNSSACPAVRRLGRLGQRRCRRLALVLHALPDPPRRSQRPVGLLRHPRRRGPRRLDSPRRSARADLLERLPDALEHLRVTIERGQHAVDDRCDVVKTRAQQRLSLDALDLQLHLPELAVAVFGFAAATRTALRPVLARLPRRTALAVRASRERTKPVPKPDRKDTSRSAYQNHTLLHPDSISDTDEPDVLVDIPVANVDEIHFELDDLPRLQDRG